MVGLDDVADLLRCPDCGGALSAQVHPPDAEGHVNGELCCAAASHRFPIHRGIPRFVSPENYAESFGYEWGLYGDLQVDSLHGYAISKSRFYSQLGCEAPDLNGLRVLEAGCGGGRFSELVLAAGAELCAS